MEQKKTIKHKISNKFQNDIDTASAQKTKLTYLRELDPTWKPYAMKPYLTMLNRKEASILFKAIART